VAGFFILILLSGRRFFESNHCSGRVNLIELLARHLVASPTDFSRILVVFPEQRPGHYLRKALGEKMGHSFLPPTIFSLDDFIDFLYSRFLGREESLAGDGGWQSAFYMI